jgi:putative ABC transport system permease protein
MNDLRFAVRQLLKNRSFSAVIVLTLALGIGVNTSIFSVVSGVLLRPLPYPELSRLTQIKLELSFGNRMQQTEWLRFNEVLAWAMASDLPVQVAAHTWLYANLSGRDEPERVTCGCVSDSLLTVLKARPVIGRDFGPEEDRPGATPVVILSYQLWQRRYGGNVQVIGQAVKLNHRSCTVIGVLPAGFQLPERYDLLLPLAIACEWGEQEHLGSPRALGRLKPGTNLVAAQASLDAIYQSVHDPRLQGRVVLVGLQADLVRGVKRQLLVLLGAVGLVLFIAMANVSNLLLARGACRQQEIAVRSALGAGRLRIARQLLTESALLALLGGLAGLLLAFWSTRLLRPWITVLLTDQYPIAEAGAVLGDVRVDRWGLAFTFGVSLLAGVLSGLVPAWEATRRSVYDSLQDGTRSVTTGVKQRRLRNGLVVAEVSLAVVLVLGTGLLLKSFLRLRRVDPGFRADRILSFTIDLDCSKYPDSHSQAAYFEQVIDALRTLPGVEAVGVNSMLPLLQSGTRGFEVEVEEPLRAPGRESVYEAVVSPEYFMAMGIPLLRGRAFTAQDRTGALEVVVVSEGLARRHFPNEDPIGKRLRDRLGGIGWQTIVGVVGDVRQFDLESWELNQQPQVYRCFWQAGMPLMSLAVKTTGDPRGLASAARSRVMSLHKDQPLYSMISLKQRLAHTLAPRRSYMLVLGVFASLALGLAAVGIYGVVSYLVTQRSHEIGVRMALGASRQAVLGLIIKQGMMPAIVGLALGLLAAIGLTRIIASQLYAVQATDPATFAGVALVLIGIALFACWVPARRATKLDPLVALRRA